MCVRYASRAILTQRIEYVSIEHVLPYFGIIQCSLTGLALDSDRVKSTVSSDFTAYRTLVRSESRDHRVGVAFSEGPKLLPFYENLVKWQLLPLYAHILSVTFTVLPQTHNREAGATTARRPLSLAWANG